MAQTKTPEEFISMKAPVTLIKELDAMAKEQDTDRSKLLRKISRQAVSRWQKRKAASMTSIALPR